MSIKKLAGQTLWYGISSIAAKVILSLQTPIITRLLNKPNTVAQYGDFSVVFAYISFINVVYTYGLETAYFRFAAKGEDKDKLFQTSFTSLFVTTLLFSTILILFRDSINTFAGLEGHTEYIIWCVLIIAADTMAAIPFAKLRQDGKPRKYAFIRVAGIFVNLFLVIYLIAYCPEKVDNNPNTGFSKWYLQNTNVGFLILANLAQSLFTFLLLLGEWKEWRFKFDTNLWKRLIAYCYPMIIVGLGGMVNETLDRPMLRKLIPLDTLHAKMEVAYYAANYKIAIFITLFIQAFKMSAEPFFFSHAEDKNAPKTYARVMKWFVITLCLAFLFTTLYIDIIKYFVDRVYWGGLGVVPILLAANVSLGIYYNLSVWYKITDKMYMGIYITLMGAFITLLINFLLIPVFGMYACAWATFFAYTSMMIISYKMGQKYYKIPYSTKKLLAYLFVMFTLFFTQKLVMHLTDKVFVRLVSASVLMYLFIKLVLLVEKKELIKMPIIGKYLK